MDKKRLYNWGGTCADYRLDFALPALFFPGFFFLRSTHCGQIQLPSGGLSNPRQWMWYCGASACPHTLLAITKDRLIRIREKGGKT